MQTSIRFGNLEVRPAERQLLLDGQPAHVGGRAFDLLLALIERRDRIVTKDELFELVWPGLVVEENNLQVHISALRKLLGPQAIVTSAGRGYRFALPIEMTAGPASAMAAAAAAGPVTYLFTDIEGSSRLWEEHPQAMAQALARHDVVCRDLIERHRGQIVKQTGDGVHAIFRHAGDAVAAAVALQLAMAEETLEPRLQARIGLNFGTDEFRDGDFYGPAVNRAARVMSAAHGGQVLVTQAVLDALRGQLPEAVAFRDLGNVRLRDLSSPERVHQVLHARLRTEFPALRSLEATPNNLPQQLNSFIGREREMAEVAELLTQHRLVTLLAMGGIGKSRLAVQLGAQLLDRFPDGVWLVELAALTDPHSVPQALATVLGLRDEPGTSLIDTLLNHLRERKLLILLDNCEHLVGACAELVKTVLQRSTGVRIFATSRDPLSIAGEMSVPLQPLSVPAAGEATVDGLLQHEAVHLFVERARAAQQAFTIDPSNAAAVAEICARLDGIPLALELAAARVRVMTPQMIASRLDQRFKLLVAADRTVLPRQKTLRALIDWSYDMLPEQEQRLFARLSVFAGGWTLEAAEEICNDEALHAEDVLDLLGSLVQKSLVALDANSARYAMLETVRQYALDKRIHVGVRDALAERHGAYFLSLTQAALPNLFGPEQRMWLQRLDADRDNLSVAIERCLGIGERAPLALQFARALKYYWLSRGQLELGLRIVEAALAQKTTVLQDSVRSQGLSDAGQICYFMGRYAQARALLEEALLFARVTADASPRSLQAVLQSLIMVAGALDDFNGGLAYCKEALELSARLDDSRGIAGTLNSRGQLFRLQGRLTDAAHDFKRVLDIAIQIGDKEGEAIALLNLAMVALTRGAIELAVMQLRKVLMTAETLASRVIEQSLLDVCSALAASQGDWSTSARLFGASEALAQKTSLRRDPADHLFLVSALRVAIDGLGNQFERCAMEGRALHYVDAIACVRALLVQNIKVGSDESRRPD